MDKHKVYKALLVEEDTHKKFKIEAARRGMTFDQFILLLLKQWRYQNRP